MSSFDHDRVTARGVRWLPGLAPLERRSVIERAKALQRDAVRYDLPGLMRELVRLLAGITIPPAAKRLFCSAFLQSAYRKALGNVGDFALSVRDEDTTPDDLWYSHKGLAVADTGTSPRARAVHSAQALRVFGAAGQAASTQAAPLAPLANLVPAAQTRGAITQALAKLGVAASKGELADAGAVLSTLKNALAQLDRVTARDALGQPDAVLHSDEFDLALVQSALSAPEPAPTATAALYGRDIAGLHQYELLDVRWLASLWNDVTRSKVPFASWARPQDAVVEIPDATTIAFAGDWGTGNDSSKRIAHEIAKLEPEYTIHLGDVYYSGTESEERKRFVELWPRGSRGSFALNSNHEMYAGGHGYFGIALSDEKFRLQHGRSYFALTNRAWLVVALDSAYAATSFYQNGSLNDQQLRWLRELMASDVARGPRGPKNVMILTHHQGLELDGTHKEPLFTQVVGTLGRGPHRWYWGHVHGVAVFQPLELGDVSMRARLVGHGGVPYAPDAKTQALEWVETQLAGDDEIPQRARNGFAFLKFGDELEETLRDEFGHVRWRSP